MILAKTLDKKHEVGDTARKRHTLWVRSKLTQYAPNERFGVAGFAYCTLYNFDGMQRDGEPEPSPAKSRESIVNVKRQ